jgi:AcrR family transcriptional regulator
MTSSLQPAVPGLRERKKQQTRDLIARVALELFDEQGFAATTIPEIARAADVSPRTVSSYFPAKEDLVFPHAEETFDRLEARLAEREDGETTAEALRGWIADEMPRWEALGEQMELQRRVIAATPGLEVYGRRFTIRGERLIAESISADLGVSPADLVARMASAATLAIFHVLDHHKDEHGDCQRTAPTDAAQQLDQALLFVSAGIRALQIVRADD